MEATPVQFTEVQKESIKRAYLLSKGRVFSQGDQNTTIQSLGTLEGIRFMLEVCNVTLDEIGIPLKDQ